MKSKLYIFIALMAVSSLLLSACVPATGSPAPVTTEDQPAAEATPAGDEITPADPAGLMATPWALQAFGGPDVPLAALQGKNITLEFGADGRAGGSAGCNTYSGGYTVDGDKLTFSPLITTMMACEPELMALEQAYLAALAKTASYRIVDGQLELLDANGQMILTFAPLESTGLEGTNWVATGVNNGRQAVVSIQTGTEITALFENGQLSGTAGCNRYTASYTTDGDKIAITMPASTMMMCAEPEGVMEQEQAFLAALPQAATFQIREDRLEIRDGDGALLASFVAAPESLVGDTIPPAELSLTSNPWALASFGGPDISLAALEGGSITLTFTPDGQASGSAGCNSYTGSYEADGSQLKFGPLASTKRMCPEGVMVLEQAFLDALGKTASYEISEGQLMLLDSAGQTLLTFSAQAMTGIEGTGWTALSVNNGREAVVSVVNGTEITATFDGQKVGGTAGCNRYSAGYTVDGNKITIELPLSTMMMCAEPEGIMEQEQAYLAALPQAATYEIRDGRLELRDANGALLADYTAQ
jgi:heat shock protein HslJ